jgi:hypothetical protein
VDSAAVRAAVSCARRASASPAEAPPGGARRGATLIEALCVLALIALTLQIGWSLTASVGRSAAALADGAESLAASRATAWILQSELDGVRAPSDLSAPAGDSISVRAFRGVAIACSDGPGTAVLVRWTGVRAPDPHKDSVLVLDPAGGWSTSALRGRSPAPGSCRAGSPGAEERWTLEPEVDGVRLLRFFERGSYHLADDAFRYRIGAGGRQPLTPASIDPAGSGIERAGADRIVLSLTLRGAHLGRTGVPVRRIFRIAGRW